MIVAVVVQAILDDKVYMVAMRYRFVLAIVLMPTSAINRRVLVRIGGAYLDNMLVIVVAMLVVQVAVVQIVGVRAMLDNRVPAIWFVRMVRMVFV